MRSARGGEVAATRSPRASPSSIPASSPRDPRGDLLDDIVDVSDEEISEAIVLLLERSKLVVEGAGAASVAALLAGAWSADRSGGGDPLGRQHRPDAADPGHAARPTLAGRYLVVRTRFPTGPASSIKLLSLFAEEHANVVSVEHHREGMDLPVTETEVELTLATRDQEHCAAILEAMRSRGYAVDRCAMHVRAEPGRRALLLTCGGRSRRARAAREERKVVTVLFADLVGFTSRAEQLDPEDVRAILGPYHAAAAGGARAARRHGGEVHRRRGHGALRGADAHEDDPERAVRAALAIRDWMREEGELEVRIGITTGEALVALDARPAAGEGMASGDVVNTAARLQAGAPSTGSSSTRRRTARPSQAIYPREAEPVRRRGRRSRSRVWGSSRRGRGSGVDRPLDVETPLVGRERELDLLVDALAASAPDRRPQLVPLVRVPGFGKIRLVYELCAGIESDPELTNWRQGRSASLRRRGRVLGARRDGEGAGGILETDSTPSGRGVRWSTARGLSRRTTDLVGGGHLRPLVGLASETSSPAIRDEASPPGAASSRRSPSEDPARARLRGPPWADDGLLDFVDHLVEWADRRSAARRRHRAARAARAPPEVGRRKDERAHAVAVPPGRRRDGAACSAPARAARLPAETQAALLQRAGGNPLYAEEFARMLRRERGVAGDGVPLPESVQGIIARGSMRSRRRRRGCSRRGGDRQGLLG